MMDEYLTFVESYNETLAKLTYINRMAELVIRDIRLKLDGMAASSREEIEIALEMMDSGREAIASEIAVITKRRDEMLGYHDALQDRADLAHYHAQVL